MCDQQNQMKPEGRVVFVRCAWMGTVRMKPTKEAFDEPCSFTGPLIKIGPEERRARIFSEPLPPGIASLWQRCSVCEVFGNRIK